MYKTTAAAIALRAALPSRPSPHLEAKSISIFVLSGAAHTSDSPSLSRISTTPPMSDSRKTSKSSKGQHSQAEWMQVGGLHFTVYSNYHSGTSALPRSPD